jgi:hypothetical protein
VWRGWQFWPVVSKRCALRNNPRQLSQELTRFAPAVGVERVRVDQPSEKLGDSENHHEPW